MIPNFLDTQPDPITGREICNRCWNGHHQAEEELIPQECKREECNCMCHDHAKDWVLKC